MVDPRHSHITMLSTASTLCCRTLIVTLMIHRGISCLQCQSVKSTQNIKSDSAKIGIGSLNGQGFVTPVINLTSRIKTVLNMKTEILAPMKLFSTFDIAQTQVPIESVWKRFSNRESTGETEFIECCKNEWVKLYAKVFVYWERRFTFKQLFA